MLGSEPSGVVRQILDAMTPLAAGGAQKRVPTAELVTALQDADALRILQPARYGGRALDADEFNALVCAVAALDGSAGWLCAMFNGAAYDVAGLSAADDIWNADARSLIAAGYQPEGQLVRSGNDRRLTGRWHCVVGGELADWLLLTAHENNARCQILVPRRNARIEPVQDQNGLTAAGICAVTVSELSILEQRVFPATGGRAGLGRLSSATVIGAGAAAAVAGAAHGAWQAHVERVRAQLAASYGTEEVNDRVWWTIQVARAASDIDATMLQIAASIQTSESDHPLDDGTDPARPPAWAQRQAAARARDAADLLLGLSRRQALDASDPVTHLWRDVHAGCRLTLRLLDGFDAG